MIQSLASCPKAALGSCAAALAAGMGPAIPCPNPLAFGALILALGLAWLHPDLAPRCARFIAFHSQERDICVVFCLASIFLPSFSCQPDHAAVAADSLHFSRHPCSSTLVLKRLWNAP